MRGKGRATTERAACVRAPAPRGLPSPRRWGACCALLVGLAGCGFVQRHPYASTVAANVAATTAAGVCALKCGGTMRDVSDGLLIGEVAVVASVSEIVGMWLVATVIRGQE